MAASDLQSLAYSEIIDLFAAGTPPEDILVFHPSSEATARVLELLARNAAGTLTPAEEAELDQYTQREVLRCLVNRL